MKKSSQNGQANSSYTQGQPRVFELKKWESPKLTSVPLSMTEGKEAQWFEGNWNGVSWSVAPS